MRNTRNAPIHFGVYRNCSAGNSGLPLLCAYFVAGCCGRRLAPSEAEGPLTAGLYSCPCPFPPVPTVADGFPEPEPEASTCGRSHQVASWALNCASLLQWECVSTKSVLRAG